MKPKLLTQIWCSILSFLLVFGPQGIAFALPQGQAVVSGSATFTQPNAQTLNINTSDKVAINYNAFNINTNEAVNFIQPSASSIALNRVVGVDPSSILGSLTGNGQVFLINPNGILFGAGANINVHGLVASTLDITNSDFLNNNFKFLQDPSKALGSVTNLGVITATNGGYAVLAAPSVNNLGVIQANLGKIALGSGEGFTLSLSGDNLISFALDRAVSEQLTSYLNNKGTLKADSGTILIEAKVAQEVVGAVVNNDGLIEANTLVKDKLGNIKLTTNKSFTNSGTIRANAADHTKAGNIEVTAGETLKLTPTSRVEAKADTANGDGGSVYLYAEGKAKAEGWQTIDISGGAVSGNGGEGELSSAGSMELAGRFLGYAQDGYAAGVFTIDPSYIGDLDIIAPGIDIAGSYYDLSATGYIWQHTGGNIINSGVAGHYYAVAGTNYIIDPGASIDVGVVYIAIQAGGDLTTYGDMTNNGADIILAPEGNLNILGGTLWQKGLTVPNIYLGLLSPFLGGTVLSENITIQNATIKNASSDYEGITAIGHGGISIANSTLDTPGGVQISPNFGKSAGTADTDISVTDSTIKGGSINFSIVGAGVARDVIIRGADIETSGAGLTIGAERNIDISHSATNPTILKEAVATSSSFIFWPNYGAYRHGNLSITGNTSVEVVSGSSSNIFFGLSYLGNGLPDNLDLSGTSVINHGSGGISANALQSLYVNEPLTTTGGEIELTSDGSVTHTLLGDVITGGGDFTGSAGTDYTINSGASINTGAGDIYIDAVNSITSGGDLTGASVALGKAVGPSAAETINLIAGTISGSQVSIGAEGNVNLFGADITASGDIWIESDVDVDGFGGIHMTAGVIDNTVGAGTIWLGMGVPSIYAQFLNLAGGEIISGTGDIKGAGYEIDVNNTLSTLGGNILLDTMLGGGLAKDIVLGSNSLISTSGGSFTGSAGTDYTINSGASIDTGNLANDSVGGISIHANSGDINTSGDLTVNKGAIGLTAGNDIYMNGGIVTKTASSSNDISFNADNLFLSDGDITGVGGHKMLYATNDINFSGTNISSTGSGDIYIRNGGVLNLSAGEIIQSGSGTIQLGDAIHTPTTVNISGGKISAHGFFLIASAGDINISGGEIINSIGDRTYILPDWHTSGPGGIGSLYMTGGLIRMSGGSNNLQLGGDYIYNLHNPNVYLEGGTIEHLGTGGIYVYADQSIHVYEPLSTSGGLVNLTSGGDIIHNAAGDITTNGGSFTGSAGTDYTINSGASIDAGVGNIQCSAKRDISTGGHLQTSLGYIKLFPDSDNNHIGNFIMDGGTIEITGGSQDISIGGSLTSIPYDISILNGTIRNLGTGKLLLNSTHDMDISSSSLATTGASLPALMGDITLKPNLGLTNGDLNIYDTIIQVGTKGDIRMGPSGVSARNVNISGGSITNVNSGGGVINIYASQDIYLNTPITSSYDIDLFAGRNNTQDSAARILTSGGGFYGQAGTDYIINAGATITTGSSINGIGLAANRNINISGDLTANSGFIILNPDLDFDNVGNLTHGAGVIQVIGGSSDIYLGTDLCDPLILVLSGGSVSNLGTGGIYGYADQTINVNEPLATSGGNIALTSSDGNIIHNANGDVTTGGGNFTATAGTDYTINSGASINTGAGSIDIMANNDINTAGDLTTAGGDIYFSPDYDDNNIGNLAMSAGVIQVTAGTGDIVLGRQSMPQILTLSGGSIENLGSGIAYLYADRNINLFGTNITTNTGILALNGSSDDTLNIAMTSGTLQVSAGNNALILGPLFDYVPESITLSGGNIQNLGTGSIWVRAEDINLSGTNITSAGGEIDFWPNSLLTGGNFVMTGGNVRITGGSGGIFLGNPNPVPFGGIPQTLTLSGGSISNLGTGDIHGYANQDINVYAPVSTAGGDIVFASSGDYTMNGSGSLRTHEGNVNITAADVATITNIDTSGSLGGTVYVNAPQILDAMDNYTQYDKLLRNLNYFDIWVGSYDPVDIVARVTLISAGTPVGWPLGKTYSGATWPDIGDTGTYGALEIFLEEQNLIVPPGISDPYRYFDDDITVKKSKNKACISLSSRRAAP